MISAIHVTSISFQKLDIHPQVPGPGHEMSRWSRTVRSRDLDE